MPLFVHPIMVSNSMWLSNCSIGQIWVLLW